MQSVLNTHDPTQPIDFIGTMGIAWADRSLHPSALRCNITPPWEGGGGAGDAYAYQLKIFFQKIQEFTFAEFAQHK